MIHRPIAAFILNMDPFLEFFILTVVSVVFVLDVVQSTREALALGQALEAMTRMKGQLDEMQLQLALLRAEAAQRQPFSPQNYGTRPAKKPRNLRKIQLT